MILVGSAPLLHALKGQDARRNNTPPVPPHRTLLEQRPAVLPMPSLTSPPVSTMKSSAARIGRRSKKACAGYVQAAGKPQNVDPPLPALYPGSPSGFLKAVAMNDFTKEAHAGMSSLPPASPCPMELPWISSSWTLPIAHIIAVYARMGRSVSAAKLRACATRGFALLKTELSLVSRWWGGGDGEQYGVLLGELARCKPPPPSAAPRRTIHSNVRFGDSMATWSLSLTKITTAASRPTNLQHLPAPGREDRRLPWCKQNPHVVWVRRGRGLPAGEVSVGDVGKIKKQSVEVLVKSDEGAAQPMVWTIHPPPRPRKAHALLPPPRFGSALVVSRTLLIGAPGQNVVYRIAMINLPRAFTIPLAAESEGRSKRIEFGKAIAVGIGLRFRHLGEGVVRLAEVGDAGEEKFARFGRVLAPAAGGGKEGDSLKRNQVALGEAGGEVREVKAKWARGAEAQFGEAVVAADVDSEGS
ncbi:hypothetical protein EV426DRAFT_718210 [Tirmania nivea]|nr:hypothetical protein EV426DRAFT_718210 [Tirmania nivea]